MPLSLEDARRLVARYVEHYNHVRLHSSIGYVTPADKLFGLESVIRAECDHKLEAARERRRLVREVARVSSPADISVPGTSDAAAIDFNLLRERISIE